MKCAQLISMVILCAAVITQRVQYSEAAVQWKVYSWQLKRHMVETSTNSYKIAVSGNAA